MTNIALATCTDEATLFYDEAPLVAELEKQGFSVFPVVWNSPEISWESYDIVLLRNTWDYHQQISAFRAWLDYLDEKEIPVLNPTPLLRWNMEKSYLEELAKSGVKTLATIFATGQSIQLETIFLDNDWSEIVVKPIISGSGDNTWIITADTASDSQQRFDWLNGEIGMMIQPVAEQIHTEGEYSLIFYAGKYSHAVLKKSAEDSIFIHEERGGSIQAIDAPESFIVEASKTLEKAEKIIGIMPTYARVDGLSIDGEFVLMELECVEPEMYFTRSPHAAERFVKVILEVIS